MFGFTIAEVFLLGGLAVGVLYSYFTVNQIPYDY